MSTKITRALVSVSDKTGLAELGKFLVDHGVEIISTGGSARALADADVVVREVSDLTEFPEILDGRVKTLHPIVHGGILAVRGDDGHQVQLDEHGIDHIDLVVVNLYPFAETVASGAGLEACVEQIDVGGPAMVRAAAKNYNFVTVVVDPADYKPMMKAITDGGGAVSDQMRRTLAAKAFAHTAEYDAAVYRWFSDQDGISLPERLTFIGRKVLPLRYGENPHQQAALYQNANQRFCAAAATQIQGKELSYNNLADSDAAFELVAEFSTPAVVIVKHANPSGAAVGESISVAYNRARVCDPDSAFGGIVAANRKLDEAAAREIIEIFTEVVIAPDADEASLKVLATKKNIRVLLTGGMPDPGAKELVARTIAGAFLAQTRDSGSVVAPDLKVVTHRLPTKEEMRDLLFAWKVCKHVKSNAIVFAKDDATVGIGAGQMSRLDSVRIAVIKAKVAAGDAEPATRGSVLASDAFFPFADGLVEASEAGATAVIQPGGSMRDEEVIAAANKAGIAMAFTGMRHFRH